MGTRGLQSPHVPARVVTVRLSDRGVPRAGRACRCGSDVRFPPAGRVLLSARGGPCEGSGSGDTICGDSPSTGQQGEPLPPREGGLCPLVPRGPAGAAVGARGVEIPQCGRGDQVGGPSCAGGTPGPHRRAPPPAPTLPCPETWRQRLCLLPSASRFSHFNTGPRAGLF